MILICLVGLLLHACDAMPMDNTTSSTNETMAEAAVAMAEELNVTTTMEPITVQVPVVNVGLGGPNEDCSDFRPGDNASSFKVRSGGVDFDFICQSPLIWDQANCSCQIRPVIITDPDCPHHRAIPGQPAQFQKRALGVWVETPFDCPPLLIWDQSRCRCEWDTDGPRAPPVIQRVLVSGECIPLFNGTFNGEIANVGPFAYTIGRDPWLSVTPVASVPGANGGAALLENARMPLWFTVSNGFGRQFQIQIRFKVLDKAPANSKVTIFSNENCDAGPQTISITYKPSDQRYDVYFRSFQTRDTSGCNMEFSDPSGFHFVDLVFNNGELSLYVDNQMCFNTTSHNIEGLMTTPCSMGLGGPGFQGYIDEAVVRKGCFVRN